ncbi:MAG: hypothetical protein M1839_002785 [Geoglossum umbratile]|nr:MAG: hypothetical protein M1839_002785 [Geoglossum umbratile]
MNDLSGLDWSATTQNGGKPPLTSSAYSYPASRPTPPPLSGRSTPLSSQASGTSSMKPSNDVFANLVSFGSSKPVSNLTLQERQKLLQEEKRRKEEERRQQFDAQFGVHDAGFWDTLAGKGAPTKTPDPPVSAPAFSGVGGQSLSDSINRPFAALGLASNGQSAHDASEDDLLAAFSAAAPVDSSSHFPPPSNANAGSAGDDDPFGLGSMGAQSPRPVQVRSEQNDDDILGLLGRPVSDVLPPKPREPSPKPIQDNQVPSKGPSDSRDKLVAELVDMGFPADKAEQALAETDSRLDVQAAVGWLLNEAHREAKQKSRAGDTRGNRSEHDTSGRNPRSTSAGRLRRGDEEGIGSKPAWMQQTSRSNTSQRKGVNGSPARGEEKDIAQKASEVGNNLFKSANSLWSTGRKKVQKAVADFQQEVDPAQPKWMRETTGEGRRSSRSRDDKSRGVRSGASPDGQTSRGQQGDDNITDEAMMLEARPPPPRRPSRQKNMASGLHPPSLTSSRGKPPAVSQGPTESTVRQGLQGNPQRSQDADPRGRLTRRVVEDESSNAYISPARRKKANAQTQPRATGPKPDLLIERSSSGQVSATVATAPSPIQPQNPFRPSATVPTSKSPTPKPISQRSKVPPRRNPPTSPSALSISASHRQKGTEAYKRGDFSSAHSAYTAALSQLPETHPTSIIILCNRALVNLKVGDSKAAVSDADTALEVIGASRGEGELISLANEGDKEMREFFEKALMRKAEGLEQMEKWGEASKVWKDAVEAGVGGAVSIQGRNRCEKAVGSDSRTAAAAPVRIQPLRKSQPPKPSLPVRTAATALSTEAVARLRAANAAAEKVDDEKFALADAVDAKLAAWKGGKEANIRALLASLDTVLWAEAGWKKVGLHELVLANKVKVVYMKGIAKVHPDKISTSATTEQRMVSAAVFSTLNEAWDKFKKENNL